jgi:HK97 family phage major capsid protein
MQLQAIMRDADAGTDGPIWFRATTTAKDRHGTVIEAAGIDLAGFQANPVIGWNHAPIRGGDVEDIVGRAVAIERGPDYIDLAVEFAPHERAQLTEKLVRGGFLNAMSVGLLPRKTATRTYDGQRVPTITESELLEASIVAVPSNPGAQRILREAGGAASAEEEMDTEAIEAAVTKAVGPLAERLDAIEQTLDEPERVPALGGARTNEGVDDLGGRWLKARVFRDTRTLMELAERDEAPEAIVRDMLSADAFLPTQVSSQLVTKIRNESKFLGRTTEVTADALTVQLPKEGTGLTAAFVAENANVIGGDASLTSVSLTAKNAWCGERIPNRVLADQPVATFQFLTELAASSLAAHFDTVYVEGTTSTAAIDVTSGLLNVTANAILHVDAPASATAAVGKIVDEYFALAEQARVRSTWIVNETYAKNLSKLLDANSRPLFDLATAPPAASIDGAQPSSLYGLPLVVHSSIPANTAILGDLRRSMRVYRRQNMTAEISRDAEFALDNSLIRIGWRFDIAVVEGGQITRFPAA